MSCWLCGSETTELATNAEAPTCKNSPCQICIAVAKVDEEINQASATVRRLLAKRRDLRSEQNRVHGSLIHRLPAELKNYIFELLLPLRDEWGQILQIQTPSGMPPSICRSWRDIAWSNPVLWSTLHIAPGTRESTSTSDPSSRIEFINDWILRSRTLPLTLHIVGGSEEELKGVFDIISQCSNRWESLSLDVTWRALFVFRRSNLQCRSLRRLRLQVIGKEWIDQPVPLLNTTMSPETIDISGVSFQSLQISWNHLTSAKVDSWDLEEIAQLFQHASQMTDCHISWTRHHPPDLIMLPVIHQRLKTLTLCYTRHQYVASMLGSLTLPCLQEFHADEVFPLKYLPALAHRSSCPLTRITFDLVRFFPNDDWDDFQPLPGITDLVVEYLEGRSQTVTIKKLLLEEYLPDLRHLTLRLESFTLLWDEGVLPLLLDRKRSRLDAADEGRHLKIFVIDQYESIEEFDLQVWNSFRGKRLKAMQLNISLREDGFEILIPET